MDKYNIVLTSSGFNDVNNYVSDEARNLFHKIGKDKKIMILANAAPKGEGNFIARENVRENFLNVGANKTDIVDLNPTNISTILDYEVIYVLGGNPTYLIDLHKNSKLKEVIIKFLEKGIFIGESAGSMILCDDLKWVYIIKKGTKPKYDIQLDTYRGLGLTDYKIFPHWNKVSDSVKTKTKEYEEEKGVKTTKLNDGEFITTNYPVRKLK